MAETTTAVAQTKVWEHIESCLDVNSSWREMFTRYGLLATLDMEDQLEDDDWIVPDVAKELELTTREVVAEWRSYVVAHSLFTPEMMVANMDYVLSELIDCGSTDELVEALSEYAAREKRDDVMSAVVEAATKRDDADEWLEEIGAL